MLSSEESRAPSSIARVSAVDSTTSAKSIDSVVVEEPLEIRIKRGGVEEALGITMRTPGSDVELAAGFLWGEGFLGISRSVDHGESLWRSNFDSTSASKHCYC